MSSQQKNPGATVAAVALAYGRYTVTVTTGGRHWRLRTPGESGTTTACCLPREATTWTPSRVKAT